VGTVAPGRRDAAALCGPCLATGGGAGPAFRRVLPTDRWPKKVMAPMLSPDTETRMLIACYLRGDLSVHDLRRQVTTLAWRIDPDSSPDHALTSRAILYLHEYAFRKRTEPDLVVALEDLFQETRRSRSLSNP
jgi:hypothetical protein